MFPDYTDVKTLHVASVVVSIVLFATRYAWRVRAPERLDARWVRIVPHVVDTVLLASALWLAWQLGRGALPWVWAKVAALLAYIVLGSIALKRARAPLGHALAFGTALLAFAYIVSVALTKSAWGVFAPR